MVPSLPLPDFHPSSLFSQHRKHSFTTTLGHNCTPSPPSLRQCLSERSQKGPSAVSRTFSSYSCCLLPSCSSLSSFPVPSTPDLFLLPYSPKHFLFHLVAPFLSRTMTRGDTSAAFATILIWADGACRFHCILLAWVRGQCKCNALTWWHRALCNMGSEISPTGRALAARTTR